MLSIRFGYLRPAFFAAALARAFDSGVNVVFFVDGRFRFQGGAFFDAFFAAT